MEFIIGCPQVNLPLFYRLQNPIVNMNWKLISQFFSIWVWTISTTYTWINKYRITLGQHLYPTYFLQANCMKKNISYEKPMSGFRLWFELQRLMQISTITQQNSIFINVFERIRKHSLQSTIFYSSSSFSSSVLKFFLKLTLALLIQFSLFCWKLPG